MPWPETGATHYHGQLGFTDKGRTIKELFFCLIITCSQLKRHTRLAALERTSLILYFQSFNFNLSL